MRKDEAQMSLYRDGKICKVCKTCRYREIFGGSAHSADWSNTCCTYSLYTGRIRNAGNPNDSGCEHYVQRKGRLKRYA